MGRAPTHPVRTIPTPTSYDPETIRQVVRHWAATARHENRAASEAVRYHTPHLAHALDQLIEEYRNR